MAGFDRRTVTTDTDELVAYDHGAHVTRWAHRGVPVVWVSGHARYEEGTAIRGGVPVCWPWFASGPDGDRSPSHGLARTRRWTLVRQEERVLAWRLTHEDLDEAAREAFGAEFHCTLTAEIAPASLRLRHEVLNAGSDELNYEVALHTYLHVGDVRRAVIEGLDGVGYYDKVAEHDVTQQGPVQVTGQTDSIYRSPGPVRVLDPVLERELHVSSTGAANTVIWNPGPEGAAEMGDFGDEEWTDVVCVETACVGSASVTLAAGEQHVVEARIDVRA
ncbi:MAG TPA: D-hexose-6-phosphate mutarotase [Ornithinimicrobium sp.]|uniref:D-hexose-6-phosphate mutarotase n=1 Tax=Ornithinimicrobium sp. TaxID=1977084 RepID=UPI002B46D772|nr:D-hexose-6-phosphate mutarotase [Ornithinimicrobium sp.]HKJ11739.1 D-hexose-6-phosphate mutarotase [Ornithinimicrobium sp.]